MKNRIAVYDTDTRKYYVDKLDEMFDIDTGVKLTDNYSFILALDDYRIDKKARKIVIDNTYMDGYYAAYLVYTIGNIKYIIRWRGLYIIKNNKNKLYKLVYEFSTDMIRRIDEEIKELFNTNTVEY